MEASLADGCRLNKMATVAVYVSTSFWKSKPFSKKYVRTNIPKSDKELKKTTRKDRPIFEIYVDKNDLEVCLITDYLPEEERQKSSPMSFRNLSLEIEKISSVCSKYEVLSSSWAKIYDGHVGRVDRPVIGLLIDEDERKILMVEGI